VVALVSAIATALLGLLSRDPGQTQSTPPPPLPPPFPPAPPPNWAPGR
jgi:hypothetical protein